ncbi:MAG: hypothetical protein D084_Lepto4C00679G0001 [Leptospirillum sp. Group IV 'UBA BS']|nr:MAG: hypothetical protein D084_Lepto4C00679G0001 [Leptospirillum sp. Group IV 'UBA BS']
MVQPTVLPFKLEATDDRITAHAGLVLLGEFLKSIRFSAAIDRAFPVPGSGAGYGASSYVLRCSVPS